MSATHHPHTTCGHQRPTPIAGGAATVTGMVVRVAGHVPTRVDLRNAATAEQQLGLTLGAVLIYLRSHYTAHLIARSWSQAAPLAGSLTPHLTGRRRGIMSTGPFSTSALIRIGGAPDLRAALIPAEPGQERPAILRLDLGSVSWELCDAASYAALRQGWQSAADLLAATGDTVDTPAA
ncbi:MULTISPECIES: hypothetical protein [unclassified Pseudonocardia]|uniref:hypothetical protein n=1 Tax=unclassified Pseudonocardia TaxID=2619320 RepID=UPI0001FFDB3C|nr:hypothetical protein [Pseudonocardia sp. Ae707_Ps1]OLM08983.1 hypothetical protein Ae707Ps1_5930 [Pseudonocardia sp. Ae707_Ps1]